MCLSPIYHLLDDLANGGQWMENNAECLVLEPIHGDQESIVQYVASAHAVNNKLFMLLTRSQ